MGPVAGTARQGRPLRLLWLIDSLTAGGAESLLAQQARRVDPRRARVEVCCLKTLGGNPFEDELRRAGVPVTNLEVRNLRDLGGFRRLEELVRDRRPDLIHAHLNDACTWGALVARRVGTPLVVTLHVFPDPAPALSRRGLRERLMGLLIRRRADRIVAVSGAVADAWSRQRGLERRTIEVVHNGVDVDRFAGPPAGGGDDVSLREELDLRPGVPVVLMPAVLRPGKGHGVLLGALPAIFRRMPEARFVFAGDGPLRESLQRRALELGVADRCRWPGFRDDLDRLYRLADLVVLPADEPDALPTALIEAMASGTPFVASRIGGIPELETDGTAGELVPPGDPGGLARAVADLLDDPGRRSEMGRRGRRRAAAELSIAAWWERIEPVYEKVVSERSRARGADSPADAPPKVVVAEFAGSGGMIHYAHQLCSALARRGLDVVLATDRRYELADLPRPFRVETIFDTWDPKPAGRELSTGPLHRLGRKLRRLPRGFRHLKQWLRLRRFLRRERPDVLQLGDVRFAADLAGIVLARRQVPMMIDICHNVRPYALGGRAGGGFRRSSIERALYRRIYRSFDRVLVHYEVNRRAFLSTYDLEAGRVGTLPLGNFEIFEELGRRAAGSASSVERLAGELDLAPDHRVVLLFGSLSRYKGIDDLLHAFVTVREQVPGARLLVVGFPMHDFDLESRRRLARRLGIDDVVRLVPRYVESAEVATWMELADVAVFPHRTVYQSASLQVARTFGLPVVATDTGANPELVDDGEDGILVPSEDPAALAAALIELLSEPSAAERLGRRARENALTSGAWDRVARIWLRECGLESRPAGPPPHHSSPPPSRGDRAHGPGRPERRPARPDGGATRDGDEDDVDAHEPVPARGRA